MPSDFFLFVVEIIFLSALVGGATNFFLKKSVLRGFILGGFTGFVIFLMAVGFLSFL